MFFASKSDALATSDASMASNKSLLIASPRLVAVSTPTPPKADRLPAEMNLKKSLLANRRPIAIPFFYYILEHGRPRKNSRKRDK
jgi:hypothetical protein